MFLDQVLLYESTGGASYKTDVESFVNSYRSGSVDKTPCGLSFRDIWGTNRYAGQNSDVCTFYVTIQLFNYKFIAL